MWEKCCRVSVHGDAALYRSPPSPELLTAEGKPRTLKSSRWGRGAVSSRWAADFQFPGCGLPGQSELRLKTSSWKREAQTKKNASSVFLFIPQHSSSTHVKSRVRLRIGSADDFSSSSSVPNFKTKTSVNIDAISHGHKSDKCSRFYCTSGTPYDFCSHHVWRTSWLAAITQHLLWHHKGLVSKTGSKVMY